jgi:uncharacterized protein
MRNLKWAASAIAFCALASCATKESPKPETPGAAKQEVQIANPASENCIQKGGKLEIAETPEGQQGFCILPDGTRCDEWALFRGECPPAEK